MICLDAIASPDRVRFERLSKQMGLSHQGISYIYQDTKGFMWFGANKGLERFDGYRFRTYKHEPYDKYSISGSDIRQITEDMKGRMWIIVGSTLNRFEPKTGRFFRYEIQPEGTTGAIHSTPLVLFADSHGDLWVGTNQTGLYRYDDWGDRFESFRHDPYDPSSISSDNISSIVQSQSGDIWIGTFGGLNRFNHDDQTFIRFLQNEDAQGGIGHGAHSIPHSQYQPPIVEDSSNNLWIISYGAGLFKLNTFTFEVTNYKHDPQDNSTLSSNNIQAIYRDRRNVLWILMPNGQVDMFNLETGDVTRFGALRLRPSKSDVTFSTSKNITEDANGLVWFAVEDQGLFCFDYESERFTPFRSLENDQYPSGNDITTLFYDRSDTLWVGTRTNGLSKYSLHRRKFEEFEASRRTQDKLNRAQIRVIYMDSRNRFWLGTEDGLNEFDLSGRRVMKPYQVGRSLNRRNVSNNRVNAITEDSTGRLWVGGEQGLFLLNPGDQRLTPYQKRRNDPRSLVANHITHLSTDSRGRVWAGTIRGGLHFFDQKRKATRRYIINSAGESNPDDITAVVESDDGFMWVGQKDGGLHRLHITSGETETIRHAPNRVGGLSHNDVSCLLMARDGTLWIGTIGGGLNRLDPRSNRVSFFTSENSSLPGNIIHGLIEDKSGNIWVNLVDGLAVISPQGDIRTYDRGDGLVSNTAEHHGFFHTKSGHIFYGGRDGFNIFKPAAIRPNPKPPPIAITAFRKLGEEQAGMLSDGDRLELSYKDSFFAFDFAALDFTYPAKNHYQYKLDGYDESWIPLEERRTASFTNLDGGKYVFRVKASNSDGYWNEEGIRIYIDIKPPFYHQTWFYVLEVLLAITLIFLGFRLQRYRLQKQKVAALGKMELDRRVSELEYARGLQLSMLPQNHIDNPSLEAYGKMRTATEVGGDYFDFFENGKDRTCVIIGDATGHGLAAGLVVGMVKMAATVWIESGSEDLSAMHRQLNLGLKKSLTRRGMGMGLGVLMIEGDRARLAFSGMPYPYHYKAETGELEALVMKGPPLGFFKNLEVPVREIELASNDYLILLSDGLAERFNPDDELWGQDKVEACLLRNCREGVSASVMAERLYDACDVFADGRGNDDDMTAVIIQFKDLS